MAIISPQKLYPRTLLKELEKALFQDNILVIVGSRQVGKTSLLSLLYEKLAKKTKIYFDLEDIQLLDEFNELSFDDFPKYLEEKANLSLAQKVFVFIDEIQYLNNPSSFLKYTFDHYRQIKLIVSGSSSLEIKKKFSDRLTGRKAFYVLYPLSFEEFLSFEKKNFKIRDELSFRKLRQGKKHLTTSDKKRVAWVKEDLSKLFQRFVLFGGYPKVVLTASREQKINILKEIQATYIRKDIKDLAQIEQPKAYNDLIEVLAAQTACLLNIDELSNTLRINRKTIERYLFLLENTFIINLLRPFYTNKRKEITKMPKIFLKDTGLGNMLLKNFTSLDKRADQGALVENFVYTELKKQLSSLDELYFWRTQTKTEVDFVILGQNQKPIPIEVRYKKLRKPSIPSGLRAFISLYNPQTAFVISQDLLEQIKLKKTIIYFLPAWLI